MSRQRRQPWIREIFSVIYRQNGWKNAESASGHGSSLANTAAIRQALPTLVAELGVRSMLDIPCGDYYWMKDVELAIDRYIGADVVPELVRSNIDRYCATGDAKRVFQVLELTTDPLPQVDLIFCRDCMVHFSFRDIFLALRNIAESGSIWLLTTTFPARTKNQDIVTGQWRPLNLEATPFHLPPPHRLISERYTGSQGRFPDKSLGLWKIAELR